MVTEYVHLAYLDVIGDTATLKGLHLVFMCPLGIRTKESSQIHMLVHISLSCYISISCYITILE